MSAMVERAGGRPRLSSGLDMAGLGARLRLERLRRILSPVLPGVEFELMRTAIPGGVDAGEFDPHAPGSREYLAMERGTLRLTLDGVEHVLRAGDSIYYAGDCRHAFANAGQQPCVYYLAMELGRHRTSERPRRPRPRGRRRTR